MATPQPKINQRKQLRYAIALLIIAASFFTWYFLKDFIQDPGGYLEKVDTTGWILALKETQNGTQAVAIKPDGTILENPQPNNTTQDRDPVWQPDGKRAYFSSNRDEKKNAFHMYRWNLSNNTVDQRTTGSRAAEHPWFDQSQPDPKHPTALLISGGVIVEFNPYDGTTRQLLPVVGKGVTQSADVSEGASSQFGPEYEHLGTSFREAKFADDRKYIVAVMRRDQGETLVVQNMEPKNDQEAIPVGIAAGEHIQFSVDEKSGVVVYCVQNFDFVDGDKMIADYLKDGKPTPYIKDGKLVKPYRHLIALVDLEHQDQSGPITASNDDKVAFGNPAASPDGSMVVFNVGTYDSTLSPQLLIVAPLKTSVPGSGAPGSNILTGAAGAASWSADGQQLTFVMTAGTGSRDVYTIKVDGSGLKNLTGGKGVSYESAQFSPASSKPAGS